MEPDLMGGALDRPIEPGDEQQQERRYGYGDEREIKFQPEHDAEHADNGQEIGEYVERRRGREVLDGLNVVGDGGKQSAGLVGIVEAEREVLQVVIHTHAQVVRHPLSYAFRVIVIDVASDRSKGSNEYR